jgi:putative oxidoreductase
MSKIYPPFLGGRAALGLLLLRLVMGAAFLFHGWPKVTHERGMMGWMGADAGMPGGLQALAAVAEFGGGIALILGLLTPLAALGLAVTMAVAAGMVHIPAGDPFVGRGAKGESWELPAVYLAASLLFLLVGPGKLSMDWCLFGRNKV